MKILKYLFLACYLWFAASAYAEKNPADAAGYLTVVAGAGYKKPVLKLIEMYRNTSSRKVVASFGNMQQISAQAQASGDVALMVGDEKYLRKLPFLSGFQPLGTGKLVLAWPKGRRPLMTDADLAAPEVDRIAHPDPEKAIYGRAAIEWMKSKGLHETLKPKLIQAATVPQVTSYLVSGEVDAGFINLTDAIGLQDRIGGYRILEDGYTPIRIVAATVTGHESEARLRGFLDFLRSDRAAAVFRSFGM